MYKLKSIIYSFFGFLVALISIRIILKFIAANPSTSFVKFWYGFTDILVYPWLYSFPDIRITGGSVIELSVLLAIIFYIVVAIIFEKAIDDVTQSTTETFLYSIINSIFKVIEFILSARFVLKIIGASADSFFVDVIYGISNIVYSPFAGIIRDYRINSIVIELSTLLILVIVILIDIGFDNLIRSILDDKPQRRK